MLDKSQETPLSPMLLANMLAKISPLTLLLIGQAYGAWKAFLTPEGQCDLLDEYDDCNAGLDTNLLRLYEGEIEPDQFLAEFPNHPDFKRCVELKPKLEGLTAADDKGTIDIARQAYVALVESMFKDGLVSVRKDAEILGEELKLIHKTLMVFTEIKEVKESASTFIDLLFCHLRSFVKRWHSKKTVARTQKVLEDLSPEQTQQLYGSVAEFLKTGMLGRFPSGSEVKVLFIGVNKKEVSLDSAQEGQDLGPLRLYLEGVATGISRGKALLISQWIVRIADPLCYTVVGDEAATGIQPAAGAFFLMREQLSRGN